MPSRWWKSSSARRGISSPSPAEPPADRRSAPVELLWDLVFVFAITQVTALLYRHQTWQELGKALLVLALIWWAWSAFVWAANAQHPDAAMLRAVLLAASVCIFIAGLAVPRAFGSESTLFAGAYAVVRLLHLVLYLDAARRGSADRSAIRGFTGTVLIGMALLLAGSLLDPAARIVTWTAAVVIDYAGPALTRERLRGIQPIAVTHFAERYGLFVIICLGESIVAIGVGAGSTGRPLNLALLAAVAAGLLVTVGLWWIYFDSFAGTAEARLRDHADPVLAASDAYSYLHLLLVAGIIVFAVGVRAVVRDGGATLPEAARLALCGGTALYLIGHLAVALRLSGSRGPGKLLTAAALMLAAWLGAGLPGWALTAVAAALVWLQGVGETLSIRLQRYSRG